MTGRDDRRQQRQQQQQPATSRWRDDADRYRGTTYHAYHNDAAHHHPSQSPQLWYPATTSHNHESPSSSSAASTSTSDAADSGQSRRALHDQRPARLHRATDRDSGDDVRFCVAFTFVFELFVIVGLALLEYFLRSGVHYSFTHRRSFNGQ